MNAAAPFIITDEQLDYWAGVFLANPGIRARGVLFETFLIAPVQIIAAIAAAPVPPARAGLLIGQRRAQAAADFQTSVQQVVQRLGREAERSSTGVADGRLVERLRHHRYPRNPMRTRVREAA